MNQADIAATTSVFVAGSTWLVDINAMLQIVATLVAIVAGCYAIAWHKARLRELNRALNRTKMYEGTEFEE